LPLDVLCGDFAADDEQPVTTAATASDAVESQDKRVLTTRAPFLSSRARASPLRDPAEYYGRRRNCHTQMLNRDLKAHVRTGFLTWR
jgi:hypothetical protein